MDEHTTLDTDAGFDGIICIGGEDWWYHNRGHFDFQIMRRLATRCPVLFVNSIAVRMPSIREKNQFAARMVRKLRSLSRGLVRIENKFWVFSPLSVPGRRGQKISGWALGPQIKWAAERAGMKRPLLWVHCPAGAPLADEIEHHGLVLQRTDRFEAFCEASGSLVATHIAAMKAKADLVVYCNRDLMDEERNAVQRQQFVTHGVELTRFVSAGSGASILPLDIPQTAKPRIGFIGGIDAHTFGVTLFLQTAARLPDVEFVLVGGCSLPDDWCGLGNVTLLGRKPYDEIADYMAAMDVLIMPWADNEWIKACNPIKLKEYLAVGRPVVTTDFSALAPYRDLVRVANTPADFADAIHAATQATYDPARARQRIATESWDAKANEIWAGLSAITEAKRSKAA